MVATVDAPSTYEELHQQYREYVEHLLGKLGVPPGDIQDAASDIFVRLYQLDALSQFNPDYHIEHGGQVVKANFRTWLSAKVSLYARGQRDKSNRRVTREPLICDTQLDGASWVEVFGGEIWDDYSGLSVEEFVLRMREYLAKQPPRSARDRCDLVKLFDLLVPIALDKGIVDYDAVEAEFHISPTSAYQWVSRLRDTLKEARAKLTVTPRTWTIGGVQVSEDDVISAIQILKTAKGIMVRQPLAKADHPLTGADKDWYHGFSAEERDWFPELEIDPQTHRKPAGHVKLAVIHRLERMLVETKPDTPTPVPAPEPEVPDTPADLFENALWRLGASAQDVDRITALAQAAYA